MSGTLDLGWHAAVGDVEHRTSRLDVVAERAATAGVGLLIMIGFASSYTTLRDLAVEVGGFSPWLAPVVPLSFDLGIIVLSLKVVVAARAGRDARVLRVLVLLLSAATVVANGAASSTTVGRLLHAVPPAMFVVCFETLAASARHDAHRRRSAGVPAPSGPEQVRPVLTVARWLLAPRQTWAIWRARVLGVAQQDPATPAAAPAGGRVPPDEALMDERLGPIPVAEADPLRPPLPADEAASDALVAGDADPVGRDDRLAVAVAVLRADPAMTAVALAEHLDSAGHVVSVRTAQRIRQRAQQVLGSRPEQNVAQSPAVDHARGLG